MLDLINQKFNKLTVIEQDGKYLTEIKWKCKCDCGKVVSVRGSKLRNGTTKSCGCFKSKNLNHKKGKDHNSYTGYEGIIGSIWCRVILNAKHRKIPIEITIKEAWELFEKQKGKCALTGLPIYFAKDYKELRDNKNTASLDRIDSLKGYAIDNVQWVHKDINYMKMNLTQDRFIELCKLISERFS